MTLGVALLTTLLDTATVPLLGFAFFIVGFPRPLRGWSASNPNKPVHKPGSKVDGGVCTCQMLGSTLLIECALCKKVRAEGDKEAAAGAPAAAGGLSRASSKTTLK